MANPTATNDASLEGAWLMPHQSASLATDRKIYIEARDTPHERPISAQRNEIETRTPKIVQLGSAHGIEGTIQGDLVSAFGLSADDWKDRLDYLVQHQARYTIWLVTTHLLLTDVVLDAGYRVTPWDAPTHAYSVELAFIDVSE